MGSLGLLNLSMHLFAAFIWIGSSAFFSLLWLPRVRAGIDPISWEELLLGLAKRYLRWSWLAIEILLLTGIFNILRVGVDTGFTFPPVFIRRLLAKLLIVAIMIGIQIGLSFSWIPNVARRPFTRKSERAVRRALVATSVGGGVAMWLALTLRG